MNKARRHKAKARRKAIKRKLRIKFLIAGLAMSASKVINNMIEKESVTRRILGIEKE